MPLELLLAWHKAGKPPICKVGWQTGDKEGTDVAIEV